MITKITDTYIRHYRDNGQTTLYIEWIDDRGRKGRTESDAPTHNPHMLALLNRAHREGVELRREEW